MPVTSVVIGLPVGDPDFGVEQGDPLVHVQALVADPVVEPTSQALAHVQTFLLCDA